MATRAKVFRFAVHPEEDDFLFLQCLNDRKLFTQARSMDDALLMTRDLIDCWYGLKRVVIELVVPPKVVTKYEKRQHLQWQKKRKKLPRKPAGRARSV